MFRILLQSIGITGVVLFIALAFFTDPNQEVAFRREMNQAASAIPMGTSSNSAGASRVEAEKDEENKALLDTSSTEDAPQQPEERTPPSLQEQLSPKTYSTLVNILCNSTSGKLPISGSGVIIDPRGVILTNAHVAQFLLLDSEPSVNLSCVIRTGSPAKAAWKASILYIPSAWVEAHAGDIAKPKPLGTGEHDFALLLITSTLDGSPLPISFPYLTPDIREKAHKPGSTVLLTAYPAEFAGNDATTASLLAFSTLTKIDNVLTFDKDTVDVFSFGPAALAQSGSSGGSVVDVEGKLIGIISTTSDGATLAQRDLRAVSLSYINRALLSGTGNDLQTTLAKNVAQEAALFMNEKAPALAQMILSKLPR